MAEPSRIRATVKDGVADVRIRMNHEMESGRRKDGSGALVPAWHITDVEVALNGRPALTAQWGGAVSKNPFLRFRLRGAKPGDRLSVAWVDTRGQRRTDEITVN